MNQQPPTAPAAQATPAKNGMSPVAWLGIGCGGLLLIAIIGVVVGFIVLKGKAENFMANPEKSVAELIVKTNPDLEMISQDEAAGEITIKNSAGETITVSYADIAEGKIKFTDQDGNITQMGSADLSQVPAWVPQYSGITDARSMFYTDTVKEVGGSIGGKTADRVEDVLAFYTQFAVGAGFTQKSSSSTNLGGTQLENRTYVNDRLSFTVMITKENGGEVRINVGYQEEK